MILLYMLFLLGESEQISVHKQREVTSYHGAGVSSGNDLATDVTAFNPSMDESVSVTITTVDRFGADTPILIQSTQGMTRTYTHQITTQLGPLQSITYTAAFRGVGLDAGYVQIESDAEISAWSSRKQMLFYEGEFLTTSVDTTPLVARDQVAAEYQFPSVAASGAERLPGVDELDFAADPGDTLLGIHNTDDFTSTIIVSGTDGLLGTSLGSTLIDVPPSGGVQLPIESLFTNMPTGHVRLETEAVTGTTLPYLLQQNWSGNSSMLGRAVREETEQQAPLTFVYLPDEGITGYTTLSANSGKTILSGQVETQLEPGSQTTATTYTAGSPGASAFLSNHRMVPVELDSWWGLSHFSDTTGTLQGLGTLVGHGERAFVTQPQVMGSRGVFRLDGNLDWENDLASSALFIENIAEESVAVMAASLDQYGTVLRQELLNLNPGAHVIPVSQLLDEQGEVQTVLLEQVGGEATLFPTFLTVGRDGDGAGDLIDQVAVIPVPGAVTVAIYSLMLEAWQSDQSPCFEGTVNIIDILDLVNNNYQCPR